MFKTHETPLQDRLALRPLREIFAEAFDATIDPRKRLASLEHALKASEGDIPRQVRISTACDIVRSYIVD